MPGLRVDIERHLPVLVLHCCLGMMRCVHLLLADDFDRPKEKFYNRMNQVCWVSMHWHAWSLLHDKAHLYKDVHVLLDHSCIRCACAKCGLTASVHLPSCWPVHCWRSHAQPAFCCHLRAPLAHRAQGGRPSLQPHQCQAYPLPLESTFLTHAPPCIAVLTRGIRALIRPQQ